MARKKIFQIYYNDQTRTMLQPGFLPLDNTKNERPDWFEFWVIKNFLEQNELDDDTWYGFLSPNFSEKSRLSSEEVLDAIDQIDEAADVLLVGVFWDQIAYFRNPWEQGEAWHPGITELAQQFFDASGRNIQLKDQVTHASTTVYSSYVIAKKQYWLNWLVLARDFYEFVENGPGKEKLGGTTSYSHVGNQYPVKTFIQERLHSIILTDQNFRVAVYDRSQVMGVFKYLFPQGNAVLTMLQACDMMKSSFLQLGDPAYLEMYERLRQRIQYTPPRLN